VAKKKKTVVRNLSLKLIQGDVASLSHPRRLGEHIGIDTQARVVTIDRVLLSMGIFVGRAEACHFRLGKIESPAPVMGLRFDPRFRWTLCGLGEPVTHNGEAVNTGTVVLSEGDAIGVGPYVFTVVQSRSSVKAAGAGGASSSSGRGSLDDLQKDVTDSMEDTGFILNIPGIVD